MVLRQVLDQVRQRAMRKRSKYRPRSVLANPVGFVLEGLSPVRSHETYLLDLKIKNSGAMHALLRGNATKDDMTTLIAMSNITEALHRLGFGAEYGEACIGGREALIGISLRAKEHGRFTPTGPEITKLNTLMELHDAQMEVINLNDMNKALAFARKLLSNPAHVTRLPVPP